MATQTKRKPMLIFVGLRLKNQLWKISKSMGLIPSRVVWTLIEMFTLGFFNTEDFERQYKQINDGVRLNQRKRLLKYRYNPRDKAL